MLPAPPPGVTWMFAYGRGVGPPPCKSVTSAVPPLAAGICAGGTVMVVAMMRCALKAEAPSTRTAW